MPSGIPCPAKPTDCFAINSAAQCADDDRYEMSACEMDIVFSLLTKQDKSATINAI
jgi:hypothetical protein